MGDYMEKVLWVRSNMKMIGAQENDGLEEVNMYLQNGWKVKHIAACPLGDSISTGQAYIVIEKDE